MSKPLEPTDAQLIALCLLLGGWDPKADPNDPNAVSTRDVWNVVCLQGMDAAAERLVSEGLDASGAAKWVADQIRALKGTP